MKFDFDPLVNRILKEIDYNQENDDFNSIVNKLKKNGYKKIGGGSYKEVYRKYKGDYCIKVYCFKSAWERDSYHCPEILKQFYLTPIYNDKKIIIQPYANRSPNKSLPINKIPFEKLNIDRYDFDIYYSNTRYYKNTQVIIDFIY